jgi:hypothetical protein
LGHHLDEMLEIWRTTRERVGLSNAHCDELANFTLGQTDKVLGPAGTKNFGPLTFTASIGRSRSKWRGAANTGDEKSPHPGTWGHPE